MFAVGSHDQFIDQIKRGREESSSVFGVLLADVRQPDTRNYILNYLDRFHEQSGKYIDFYIPGYFKENIPFYKTESIELEDKKYYFSGKEYDNFADKFSKEFNLESKGVPVLYLIEWEKGTNFKKSKILEIDLDGGEYSIKMTVTLFKKIFDLAKSEDLLGINNRLVLDSLFSYIKENLVNDMGIPLLIVSNNIGKRILKFRSR